MRHAYTTATCDRCRQAIRVTSSGSDDRIGAAGNSADNLLLGDSYVVLPQHKQQSDGSGSTTRSSSAQLPDLSQMPVSPSPASSMLQVTSRHEQLRTVSRLLELSDTLRTRAPAAACHTPGKLPPGWTAGSVSPLQRRWLRSGHNGNLTISRGQFSSAAEDVPSV